MTEPDPERDFLVRSLADLELERAAGDLSDADYADLKTRYERKLAEVPASGSSDPQEPEGESTQKRSWGRIVATVAVIALVAIGAGIGVAVSSGSRDPGEQVSGSVPSTSSQRLAEAATLAGEGKLDEAIAAYQAVLDENPEDVEALTYFGWLLRNVGVSQEDDELRASGVRLIERATQLEPTYAEAWFFRGIIFLRDEDESAKAVDALKLALANDPIPEVESAARELLAEIAQQS